LDINIIDYLLYIYLRLRYVVANNIVVLNNNLIFICRTPLSTAPLLNDYLKNKMSMHEQELIRKAKGVRSRVKVLESICGAMDRDRTDYRHGSLCDAFKSHIASSREEYNAIFDEIRICGIYSTFGHGVRYSRDRLPIPVS
jgi:hypothetical protein